jgi:hypothetical protein
MLWQTCEINDSSRPLAERVAIPISFSTLWSSSFLSTVLPKVMIFRFSIIRLISAGASKKMTGNFYAKAHYGDA